MAPVPMEDPSPDVVRTIFQRHGHSSLQYQRENDKRFSLLLGKYLPESRTSSTNWCLCGKCGTFPTVRDNLCCREVLDDNLLRPGNMDVIEGLRRSAYRYYAYGSFVLWRYEYLGLGKRVKIPSCVRNAIVRNYPSCTGEYGGFQVSVSVVCTYVHVNMCVMLSHA
ncbi:hypothetical protein OESDEN_05119 [Oesophagostomum dentatum]|uniref:P2X purinoreceptor 7 intracellular domain-containing protein n=1 Tax=Oesophagostomum dentatum TaxID=61180 RepID=A0A0B1THQ6_OESDE|nr:hypothetical protein OESDEN_05119 [Oesophagostomum dentatum]